MQTLSVQEASPVVYARQAVPRKKSGSRPSAGTEEAKRAWEARLPELPTPEAKALFLLSQAVPTLLVNKEAQGSRVE